MQTLLLSGFRIEPKSNKAFGTLVDPAPSSPVNLNAYRLDGGEAQFFIRFHALLSKAPTPIMYTLVPSW